MNKKLLFLIGAFFAMTTAVFSGNTAGGTMSIDFAALGGNYPDKTAVAISSEVATIGGTSMGTCMVGEEALDTKFVLEVGTSWLIRMTNGLNQNNSNYRAMGFRNCTANQIITIVGTGDPNPSTNATLKTQDGNTYIYTVTADGDVKFNPARHLYFTSVSVENPAATPVETPAIELTPDATGKQWSLAEMPGYDVELQVEYKTDTKVAVTYDGEAVTEDGISAYMKYEDDFAGKLEAAVSELESTTAVEGATVTYTSSDATVLAFKSGEEYVASGALADIAFLKEGSAELTVAYAGDADNAPASATVKVNVAWMKYSVEMSSDVQDVENWEIVPTEAKEGTIVTATYKGNLKLKGVKAAKKEDPLIVPLTMEALTEGTIVINYPIVGMQYAVNGGEKTQVTSTSEVTINVAAGDKVQLYGNGTEITAYQDEETWNSTHIAYGTAKVKVYGNIMSLVDEENFASATTLTGKNNFLGLFESNTTLTDASNLVLPATTLANNCYSNMFNYCSALTAAPELPATTLADNCYAGMFYDCDALTAAPELPATTLAGNCYNYMFYDCDALTAAPELPATTMAEACYTYMFANCTALTTAPELPAETLAGYCYSGMFSGCTNLSSVTCKATNIDAVYSTVYWLYDAGKAVTGTKTFKGYSSADWSVDSDSGIPEGWIFIDLGEE